MNKEYVFIAFFSSIAAIDCGLGIFFWTFAHTRSLRLKMSDEVPVATNISLDVIVPTNIPPRTTAPAFFHSQNVVSSTNSPQPSLTLSSGRPIFTPISRSV